MFFTLPQDNRDPDENKETRETDYRIEAIAKRMEEQKGLRKTRLKK